MGGDEQAARPARVADDWEPDEVRVAKFYTKYILGVYGTNSYVPIMEGRGHFVGERICANVVSAIHVLLFGFQLECERLLFERGCESAKTQCA